MTDPSALDFDGVRMNAIEAAEQGDVHSLDRTINILFAEIDRLRAENERLNAIVAKLDRHIRVSKDWGGMNWNHRPMAAHRVKELDLMIQSALDEKENGE